MTRSQFAAVVTVCGTVALVGWDTPRFGFDSLPIESTATPNSDPDTTGSIIPLSAEARSFDAEPATAMNSLGEAATSDPDSTEPAIPGADASAAETPVVEAPLLESRGVIPLSAETRPVDAAPATAMNPLGEAAASAVCLDRLYNDREPMKWLRQVLHIDQTVGDDPDSTEPAILSADASAAKAPVAEAPLPESRPTPQPEKPVQLALASPSDLLNESPRPAARPATPISDPDAAGSEIPLSAETRPVDATPATAMNSLGEAATSDPDSTEPATPSAGAAAAETAIVEAALPDSHPPLPPEKPVRLVSAFPSRAVNDPLPAVQPLAASNECLVEDICIDDYLWSLYERTPKFDTNKVAEKIKKTVKKKGKTRTVIATIVKYVVGDFTWKDPIAAQKAGMSLRDYVIGGMDRGFKRKLYHALRAVEKAGFMPGITSAFRDDYRQAIATGNKAASDSSYHGGSRRGGYGHGLAVDRVSVEGGTRLERYASSDELWKWIDAHDKQLGIGRPYRDRDPPHVAPIDGKEYTVKRAWANVKAALQKKRAQAPKSQATKPATAARANAGPPKRAIPEKPSAVSSLQTRATEER
jgi:hypothetical protein